MTNKWKLSQTKQCATCPWKQGTSVKQIPGYDRKQHEELIATIAGDSSYLNKVMACHQSSDNAPYYCIGWLYNQITVGNNIAMRIRLLSCQNISEMSIDGDQKQSFEDTFS